MRETTAFTRTANLKAVRDSPKDGSQLAVRQREIAFLLFEHRRRFRFVRGAFRLGVQRHAEDPLHVSEATGESLQRRLCLVWRQRIEKAFKE
jgi:hypothetical protein